MNNGAKDIYFSSLHYLIVSLMMHHACTIVEGQKKICFLFAFIVLLYIYIMHVESIQIRPQGNSCQKFRKFTENEFLFM